MTSIRTHKSLMTSAVGLAVAAGMAGAAWAAGPKLGLAISVDGEGFFLNPVVNKVLVAKVEKGSLADAAGIVAGDEILLIEGQAIKGKRASELKPYLDFKAGETRTLHLRHASGEQFDARITKPPAE